MNELSRAAANDLSTQVIAAAGAGFAMVEWRDDGETSRDYTVAPLHRHRQDHEAWYVRDGRLGFRLDSAQFQATPGQLVWAHPGQVHTYWNAGPGPARYLLIASPRIFTLIDAIHAASDRSSDAMRRLFAAHEADLLIGQ